MLDNSQKQQCRPGLEKLNKPVLPLVRLAGMLFITGPFSSMEELLAELPAEIDTSGINYQDPARLLEPHLDDLRIYQRLKTPEPPARIILSPRQEPLEAMTAIDAWVSQNILNRELEGINSLLCGPCACSLCCTGPEKTMAHDYFEIPLSAAETSLFPLASHDSAASQATTAGASPELIINDQPFWQQQYLINWQSGWSMILPRASTCPHLDPEQGGCRIYEKRPDVCRRPQIFAYMLEEQPEKREIDGGRLPVFFRQNNILAIWDCPYIQAFQEEIGRYADLCEMEIIFKKNKA